ncbi:MAG: TolC family protein [Bacteroidia bacterium]|nr:TolC family protein [Bacteroidia bacterium]
MKNKILVFALVFFCCSLLKGQDSLSLSLEKCMDLAFKNNLAYANAELQFNNGRSRQQQAGANFLPTVSGFANQGISTGKSINPYTNSFINQEVTTGQYGLSASMNLFSGFSNINTLQQNNNARKASSYDLQQARIDLQIQVTQIYVQVLNAEEQVNQAKAQIEATNEQLKRIQNLHQSGAISPSVLHDTRGQLANDKIALINARSFLLSARMTMAELINTEIPATTKFEKINTEVSAEKTEPDGEQLFGSLKERAPMVLSGKYKTRSVLNALYVSRGSLLPSLALVGNIGSNYSSAAVLQRAVSVFEAPGSDYVIVNGTSSPVYQRQTEFSSEKINFNNQLRNNLFTYIGLSLQVPIFNGLRTKQQIDFSRNAYEYTKVQEKNMSTRFRSQVVIAANELKNSKEKYVIYLEQLSDYEQSYEIAKSRFEKGAISTFEFITAKTNYEKAKAGSITAKYECVYRKKVVELYQGL